jgi:two-component system, NarL family, sensor histidine kinase DesK
MATNPVETTRGPRWLPYIYLVYLGFVFIQPIQSNRTFDWIVTLGSLGLFLPLYFAFHAAADRHWRRAMVINVAIAALGLAIIPVSSSGSTYIIYSAALVALTLKPRAAALYLLGLTAAVGIEMLFLATPYRFWIGVPTMMGVVIIGGMNVFHIGERRQNAALRMAHEEIEAMATLAERERIARDLHDLLGHTLTVIALKAELASKLSERDPVRAAQETREVERVAREALTEVRNAVEGYHGRGFAGELRNAAQTLRAAGVRLDSHIEPVTFSMKQEGAIALALREAVTNIVRHARASVCQVRLGERGGQLELMIEDDGVGGSPREGHGLTGMRERVAAAGGTVTIDGKNGMSVAVRFPLSDRPAQAVLAS